MKFRTEEFGGVIFDTKKEKVYFVNQIGKNIISALLKDKSKEEIIEYLNKQYDSSKQTIKEDFEEFINQLEKIGILEKIREKKIDVEG